MSRQSIQSVRQSVRQSNRNPGDLERERGGREDRDGDDLISLRPNRRCVLLQSVRQSDPTYAVGKTVRARDRERETESARARETERESERERERERERGARAPR